MKAALLACVFILVGFLAAGATVAWQAEWHVHCGCKARVCTWPCRPDAPEHGCCEPGICDCVIPNPGR